MIYSIVSSNYDFDSLNKGESFIDLHDGLVVNYTTNEDNRYLNYYGWSKIKSLFDTFEEHIYNTDDNFEYETIVFGFYIPNDMIDTTDFYKFFMKF